MRIPPFAPRAFWRRQYVGVCRPETPASEEEPPLAKKNVRGCPVFHIRTVSCDTCLFIWDPLSDMMCMSCWYQYIPVTPYSSPFMPRRAEMCKTTARYLKCPHPCGILNCRHRYIALGLYSGGVRAVFFCPVCCVAVYLTQSVLVCI